MKPEIHPKYYPQARVMCACGKTWTTGATQPEIRVDVCFNCHPFYTGEQRIVDTAGRVDRFRMRLAQKREEKATKKVRKQRILVVNPDEKPEEAVAEAAAIVDAATEAAPEVVPAPVAAAEPVAEAVEDVEEVVRVRTVLEDESGALEVRADDDEKPRRRATTRKPRARRTPQAVGAAPAAEVPAPAESPAPDTGAAAPAEGDAAPAGGDGN